ncbi:MAG: trigger factor [Verrucomicrobiota bacterium]
MHVTTEQKENCVIDLHVTLPAERFEKEWQRIAEEYCRLARIPGFRKGKAPRSAVEKKYGKEIKQEATEKLMEAAVREAIQEKKMELAQYPQIKDVRLEEDHTLHVTATLITKPEIELANYRGLEVSVEKQIVDDAVVESHLTKMREDVADFVTVEGRGLEMDDFAVLDYSGTLDGVSLEERYPDLSPSFSSRQHAWFRMEKKSPLPEFAEALLGLKADEEREITITFSKTCPEEVLRGATVTYAVKLHEIKARQLPPLDDAFANKLKPGLTLEALKKEICDYLQQTMDYHFHQKTQDAVAEKLVQQNPCDPPAVIVQREATNILKNVIRENQERGVPEEMIKSHQEELMASAKKSAEEKVKLHFLLNDIAEKEKIVITPEELQQNIIMLSQRYKMSVEKLLKELKKNHALGGIQEDMIFSKTLQWLLDHATITELPVSSPAEHDGDHDDHSGHVHGPHCRH